ncbi:MAG: translocation/assembly module TamB domain-containing protein, partial [Kofleriaceae bacterium]
KKHVKRAPVPLLVGETPVLLQPTGSDTVQAWALGTITVRTELAPTKPIEPEAWIELTELSAQLDHRASDGRITPLAIRVRDQHHGQRAAMSIHVTPSSLEFACRDDKVAGGRAECSTVLETPAGDIVINGHATERSVAIVAKGDLDLGQLAGLLDQQFSAVAGHVRLTASIAGALRRPTLEAAIDLDPDQIWQHNEAEREARRDAEKKHVKRAPVPLLVGETPVLLQPTGSDTVLTAPRGLIKLANGTIGFTDVLVQIRDDRNAQDEGELHVAGTIALDGTTPVSWSVLLSGKLAGKMLQVVAPNLVSQASGLIGIDGQLVLSGTGPRPALSGTLSFDHFSIVPRGSRRELSFNDGSIEIATETAGEHRTYTFDLADINGTLDDGQLSNISGSLQLRDGELTQAQVRLDATGIPFRIPQTLDLVVTANNVELSLDSPGSNWKVTGVITVVDGAYLRNFELTDRIQTIGINSAPSKPFWEEYPTLGSAELHLTLIVQLFAVRNNIATIEFRSDSMQISGSPRDPRLSGGIRVTHGEFRIPLTRAAFICTSGTVDFAENQPASNPDLHVTSDADYRDLSGQDHVITASIAGTLQQPTWDLRTSTGYNKSQTLSLLVLGQNQEQLRRSLGDQTLGGDPTRADPTTNPSQGFADQIVKDLAGDWVSGLLGNSLTKLTGLDVLRIEIGFGSIGFHVEKKILENAKLLGDAEQTIRGTTIKARAELKTPFVIVRGGEKVSLQGGYLKQNYYDPAEQDIEDINVKLVYRVFIP